MLDRYKRTLNYLRISVTDRCNLRCQYCMPENHPTLMRHEDMLSFEEIQQVVAASIPMGINKVRFTGGEPLVRKDITELVSMIARLQGLKDLSMTTNATLLDTFAEPLAKAGLHRINISLDTIHPEKYKSITRGGNINKVFDGIRAAQQAGLTPIKVNCVVSPGEKDADAIGVRDFCKKNGLYVRYIQQMDLQSGRFAVVEGGTGGDCKKCNRLRLTSDGKIKPCLFSDLAYDVREEGIPKALEMALENKPEKGTVNHSNCFHNIGG